MNSHLEKLANQLTNKYLLVDTNFLIDSFTFPREFAEVINFFRINKTTLMTAVPVATEFLRGSNIKSEYSKKEEYLYSIVNPDLASVHKEIVMDLEYITKIYRLRGSRAQITDLLLAAIMKHYSANKLTYLLSSDHLGFPTYIFNVVDYFPVELGKETRIFGIFEYSNDKAEKSLQRFEGNTE